MSKRLDHYSLFTEKNIEENETPVEVAWMNLLH